MTNPTVGRVLDLVNPDGRGATDVDPTLPCTVGHSAALSRGYDPQLPFTPTWLPCVMQRSLGRNA